VRLALAQINACVGDLAGNVERCLAAIEDAGRQGAALVVLPEMAVPGYPPRDILLDSSFVEAAGRATADLARRAASAPPVVVGGLAPAGRRLPGHPGLYNAALLLQAGEVRLLAAKRLLPAYDVFFEPRWFLPGPALPPATVAGRRIGGLVCEDLWDADYDVHPGADLLAAGAELLVCIAASPFQRGVLRQRLDHARRQAGALVYVNLCGGQDELIFDGRSFALDASGRPLAQLAGFEEEVRLVEMDAGPPAAETAEAATPDRQPDPDSSEETLYRALVLGVRDFARKNRLERVFLGLSGGVDSAVVAAIAAEALGPERVTAVAIPSRYTDPRSTACAREWAGALGIDFDVVELEPLHRAAEASLGPLLAGGTAAENVQARLRAMILMSFVNHHGGLLLNTSNKTELALGYATLYGDMAGTLCPIADLTKPQVMALARWIDARRGGMPPFILERPPSAELRPDQVDPFDYARVAPAMERLVQADRSDLSLRRSEHKRWQAGVVLKVSARAFGTGRMIPITRR
jgi:NAD+ synthase (glutamine-hydrolysing)